MVADSVTGMDRVYTLYHRFRDPSTQRTRRTIRDDNRRLQEVIPIPRVLGLGITSRRHFPRLDILRSTEVG